MLRQVSGLFQSLEQHKYVLAKSYFLYLIIFGNQVFQNYNTIPTFVSNQNQHRFLLGETSVQHVSLRYGIRKAVFVCHIRASGSYTAP